MGSAADVLTGSRRIALMTSSVVSGLNCQKETPGGARVNVGAGASTVLNLTLAIFSAKKTWLNMMMMIIIHHDHLFSLASIEIGRLGDIKIAHTCILSYSKRTCEQPSRVILSDVTPARCHSFLNSNANAIHSVSADRLDLYLRVLNTNRSRLSG